MGWATGSPGIAERGGFRLSFPPIPWPNLGTRASTHRPWRDFLVARATTARRTKGGSGSAGSLAIPPATRDQPRPSRVRRPKLGSAECARRPCVRVLLLAFSPSLPFRSFKRCDERSIAQTYYLPFLKKRLGREAGNPGPSQERNFGGHVRSLRRTLPRHWPMQDGPRAFAGARCR